MTRLRLCLLFWPFFIALTFERSCCVVKLRIERGVRCTSNTRELFLFTHSFGKKEIVVVMKFSSGSKATRQYSNYQSFLFNFHRKLRESEEGEEKLNALLEKTLKTLFLSAVSFQFHVSSTFKNTVSNISTSKWWLFINQDSNSHDAILQNVFCYVLIVTYVT